MSLKEYSTERIRNVALVSHSGAGKTTVGDAILFVTGGNDRFGRVDDETSVLIGIQKKSGKTTISTGLAPVEWSDCKINILIHLVTSTLWERSVQPSGLLMGLCCR